MKFTGKTKKDWRNFAGPGSAAPVLKLHKDVARALQDALELIIFHVLDPLSSVSGNLCLAGGVALNCTMTGKMLYRSLFKNIFVQPASGDSGLPLGAALKAHYISHPHIREKSLPHVYLGSPSPCEDTCHEVLSTWEHLLDFDHDSDITATAARLFSEGNVIGWFQGASEYGPRALGNRSILADARPEQNKDLINMKIKNREGFRPFALSVTEDRAAEFFEFPDVNARYPFMTFILNVQPEFRSRLAAITHVDGTARIHTVSHDTNPRYFRLLKEFEKLTGFPILLNTSFNNQCEPIVDSPDQAITCFLTTKLDYLVVGNYLVRKRPNTDDAFRNLYPRLRPFVFLHRAGRNGSECHEI